MSQLSKRAAAALAAVCLSAVAPAFAPAFAQVPLGADMKLPPPDSVLNGVEITAPKTISRERYGVVDQLVNMSVKVPYSDLDMRSPAGIAELDKRVKLAANYVCDQLSAMYPVGSPDDFYCAKQAIGDAQPQVIKAHGPG
jgi:UrcA family protein